MVKILSVTKYININLVRLNIPGHLLLYSLNRIYAPDNVILNLVIQDLCLSVLKACWKVTHKEWKKLPVCYIKITDLLFGLFRTIKIT